MPKKDRHSQSKKSQKRNRLLTAHQNRFLSLIVARPYFFECIHLCCGPVFSTGCTPPSAQTIPYVNRYCLLSWISLYTWVTTTFSTAYAGMQSSMPTMPARLPATSSRQMIVSG